MKVPTTLFLLTLAGCSSFCPPPKVVVEKVQVPVVITEKCVSAADLPELPPTRATQGGTMTQDAAAATADALLLRQYAESAKILLTRCLTKE